MADLKSFNEQKRLEALHSYDILDTDTEGDFDDLTQLAAAICETPISLISFVDKDRQWFKSHHGLDERQTDRCHSFCSHAIQNPEHLMQVEDAQHDQRFQDNPLVTGSPDIRFYAGIPLLDIDGYALGSLCVIDNKPKILNESQQKALRTIGNQVIDKLLLRKNNKKLLLANKSLIESNVKLKATEERLKQSEKRLKSAISAANLATWQMDFHNRQLSPSPRMKELFDFNADEPMSCEDAVNQIAESHRQQVIDSIYSSVSKVEPIEFEFPIIGFHDKKMKWLCANVQSYQDMESPNISYLSGTIADITERKLDEQRRTDFVGMVSHELRNPLTAIKAYADLVNRLAKKAEDGFLSDKMSKIDSQVKRMEALINGFLDVARLGEGKIMLEKSQFDLANLINDIEIDSLEKITSHKIIFEPAEICIIEADRNKIEQVVVNFINNAVKYSPDESVITVNCCTQDGFVTLSVKDQGMGIPLKDRPFIFDRFFRVESDAMKNKKGFGMGLYICKEIIERHNGQIGMQSNEDVGTTFWFRLPVTLASA